MSSHDPALGVRNYEVHVGHWHAQVPGRNAAEAIEQARKRMCDDMPRLWDVITQLTADRFRVEMVG